MVAELSDSIPDLGSVWRSGSGPLCITGVVPMPTLDLPEFPGTSGHRHVRPSLDMRLYAFPPVKLIPAILCRVKESGVRLLLVAPFWRSDVVLRADSSSASAPWGDSDQAGPALSASGQDLASSARDLEAVGMALPGPLTLISSLPAKVQERTATRKLYSSKWKVFESWCLTYAVDPVNCSVGSVLEFLQEKLAAATTTLRVYIVAICHSERSGWNSPGEASDGLCVYAWHPTAENRKSYWSSFLGLISSSWGSNGSPVWVLRDSSWANSDS